MAFLGSRPYLPLATDDLVEARQISRSALESRESDFTSEKVLAHAVAEGAFCLFVEAGWFQVLTGGVILANIVTMVLETDDPKTKDGGLYIIDFAMLCFYIFELVCRSWFFRRRLWKLERNRFTAWMLLDATVVVAGIVDELVVPLLPGEPQPLKGILKALRLLRLFRVLKVLRIFSEADLAWTEEARFQSFIGLVIIANSLMMGLETDINWYGWFFIEQALLTVYVFELAVRLKRLGLHFLSCANSDFVWNLLDFVIVMTSVCDTWVVPLYMLMVKAFTGHAAKGDVDSVADIMMLVRMLRLMRILRLAKLVKSVRPLFHLVSGVLAALQGVVWVLVLTIVVLYALAIIATRLIGHGLLFPEGFEVPEKILEPFKSVPDSMFTLFRVMSGASSGEQEVAINMLMQTLPSVKFGFVFFMVTSSWTLLSILTAVVSENMISTTGDQAHEMAITTAEEDRQRHINDLTTLFRDIDVDGDGLVGEEALETFLADKNNQINTSRICRVPMRDVRQVFHALAHNGEEVCMQQFVECLVVVGQPVTEKSVLKLEARLQAMQFAIGRDERVKSEFEELVREELQLHRSHLLRLAEALEDRDASNRTAFFRSHSHLPQGQQHSPTFGGEVEAPRGLQQIALDLRRDSARVAATNISALNHLHGSIDNLAARFNCSPRPSQESNGNARAISVPERVGRPQLTKASSSLSQRSVSCARRGSSQVMPLGWPQKVNSRSSSKN